MLIPTNDTVTIAATNSIRFKILTLIVPLRCPLECSPSEIPGDEEHKIQDEKHNTFSFLPRASQ